MHFLSLMAFYVDPGSGSMILQLLLGGVSGIYVIFRLFKQKILRTLGIRTQAELPAALPLSKSVLPENENQIRRSS